MINSDKCKYAHGIEDLKKIECVYGVRCYNAKCEYDHGEILDNNIEFSLFTNISKTKKAHISKNIIEKKKTVINKNINKENTKYVIKRKNKEDSEIDNKLISIIDNYYINIINTKNNIINDLNRKINYLENKEYKFHYKKKNQKNLYNKYYIVGTILKDYSMDNIEKQEKIKSLIKDKNIYKIKLRSNRVIEYMNTLSIYNIDEYINISKILNSTKESFTEIINKIKKIPK